jgi:hypothetical protein
MQALSTTAYLKATLVAALGFLAAVLLLTVGVDAYGTAPFHLDLPHVNAVRAERAGVDRLVKPYDIIVRKPKTLLIGTSRVKEGLDPTALGGTALAPAYNAGIDFLTLPASLDLLRFVLPRTPSIRTAFIEVNFEHFYGAPPPSTLPRGIADMARDYVSMFLSYSAVNAALRTVAQNKNYHGHDQYLHPDGLVEIWPQNLEFDTEHFFTSTLLARAKPIGFRIGALQPRWFSEIREECARYHVQCVYFIAPYHPLDLATWSLTGHWDDLEKLKRFVLGYGRLWDFTLYSDVVEYRNLGKHWWDINHFNHEVGAWMLKIMAGERPADAPEGFGVELTEANLPSVLARWREQRERWLAANPDVVRRIEDVLARNR